MLTFARWSLLEANKRPVLTHLTHIEDLILTKFDSGAAEAVSAFERIIEQFGGSGKRSASLTVKIDGSPSLVAGKDPADGRFFIGTKGVFAQNPKIAKSHAEVNTLYGDKGGLADKMHVAFDELSKMSWPVILQGDLLFTPSMKKIVGIDGVKYVTFKPNTIVYAIPVASELGSKVVAANFGIAFHTNYSGAKSLATMTAKSGANIAALKPPSSLLLISPAYNDLSGQVVLSDMESNQIVKSVTELKKKTSQIKGNEFLRMLQSIPALQAYFMQFQNSLVRKGEPIANPADFANKFTAFLQGIQQAEMGTRTTAKGQSSVDAKFQGLVNAVAATRPALVKILEWQNLVINLKLFVMNALSKSSTISTFYDSGNGLVAGGHEGFVSSDKSGNMVKLVDRSEFSRRNLLQNN